jgi:hypothetical protein
MIKVLLPYLIKLFTFVRISKKAGKPLRKSYPLKVKHLIMQIYENFGTCLRKKGRTSNPCSDNSTSENRLSLYGLRRI